MEKAEPMNSMHRRGIRAIAAGLALALAGCAGTGGPARQAGPDPADLEALSEQRWQHMIAGEFADAWEFFTPGYQAIQPKAEYAAGMKDRPVHWIGADYQSHECSEPEACQVKVAVRFKVRVPVTGVGEIETTRVLTERWIFLDGRWAYLPPEAVR